MTGREPIADLLERLQRLDMATRHLIGITGAPGAGKSTLADRLATRFGSAAVVVAMDGFHLRSSEIAGTPLARRRGAPDTFDATAFVAVLRRLRTEVTSEVLMPRFDRTIDDPIADAVAVTGTHRIVIVEGNYLLHDEGDWRNVADLLDEVWYLEQSDESRRIDRLVARHVEFGKSPAAAQRWVLESDEGNAALVARQRSLADLVVSEQPNGELIAAMSHSMPTPTMNQSSERTRQ